MTDLSPEENAALCEGALRRLVETVMDENFGSNWVQEQVPKRIQQQWNGLVRKQQAQRFDGLHHVSPEPFSFSDFRQLQKLVAKHQKLFEPVFGNMAATLAFWDRFAEIRNKSLHGKTLVAYETQLLQGISGLIRNQITMYLSTKDDAGDYYPRIETVWDSFGFVHHCTTSDIEYQGAVHSTGSVVRPGDVVTISMTGVDPQDRPLDWRVNINTASGWHELGVHRSGQQVDFSWRVTELDVGETTWLTLFLSATNTPFHRCGDHDQRITLSYRVRPPLSVTAFPGDSN